MQVSEIAMIEGSRARNSDRRYKQKSIGYQQEDNDFLLEV